MSSSATEPARGMVPTDHDMRIGPSVAPGQGERGPDEALEGATRARRASARGGATAASRPTD